MLDGIRLFKMVSLLSYQKVPENMFLAFFYTKALTLSNNFKLSQ